LNVLVKLKAEKSSDSARPPLDLALVVDTSGSMRGDKIRDSKMAAIELINSLAPNDRVTLISYSGRVHPREAHLMDEAGKGMLKAQISRLNASGSTALGPALFTAFDALQTRNDGMRLRHVILMSDGRANVGEKRPEVIGARAADAFRKGISVTSMGVGLDYNEDLMTRVADQGGGRYHFIEKSSQIAGLLTDELKGLVGTVARNVVLSFKGSDGIEITKVFGYPVERLEGASKVRVGFMGSEQSRDIMLRLSINPKLTQVGTAGPISLGALQVDFVDVNQDHAQAHILSRISVKAAKNLAAANQTMNQEVAIRLGELEAANRVKIAAQRTESGDFDGARRSLGNAIADLAVQEAEMPSPRLRKKLKQLRRARAEIQQAAGSVSARKSYSKKYKARAYREGKR
jgi:Ca-activated chloride channel family protein